MLRRVALVRTDVSEELSATLIRVTRIGELGTTLAVTNNRRTLRRNTKTTTRRNIPEDAILHSHRRENLKSYFGTQNYWVYGCVLSSRILHLELGKMHKVHERSDSEGVSCHCF
jgi:hypothetical protein